MTWRLFLFVGLAIGLSTPLWAQQRFPMGGQNQFQRGDNQFAQQGPQPASVDGVIATIGHGVIMVTEKSGKSWRVSVPNNAKVQLVGTATADYLTSGMIVDFNAELEEQRATKEKAGEPATKERPGEWVTKEKVGELTIVTASEQMGITSAADSGAAPDDNAVAPRPVLKANTARTRQKAAQERCGQGRAPCRSLSHRGPIECRPREIHRRGPRLASPCRIDALRRSLDQARPERLQSCRPGRYDRGSRTSRRRPR